MADLYLRPIADVYSTHTKTPADSQFAYTLVDDESADFESTSIGIVPAEANTVYTASSSFILGEQELLKGNYIDGFVVSGQADGYANAWVSTTGIATCYTSWELSSNGVICYSNVLYGDDNEFFPIDKFTNYDIFLQMLQDYVNANGKTPEIKLTVTNHFSATKTGNDLYISQIYLKLSYKSPIHYRGYDTVFSSWRRPKSFYQKRNETWFLISPAELLNLVDGDQFHTKGHNLLSSQKNPTCTSDGATEKVYCAICNEVFVEPQAIPATGHTIIDVEATEATCSKVGYTAGTRCSVCYTYLSGHEEIAKIEHTPTEAAATEPTCGTAGYTAGTKCSACNTYLSGHEKIPATGNHTPTEVAATEPTCGAIGYTAGTQCSVCSTWLSGHDVIPVTGNHTYVDANDGIAATSYDMGLTSRTKCSVCGNYGTRYKVIPSTGHTHTVVTVPAVAPTCISVGYTEGTKCSVCGTWLSGHEELPIDSNAHVPTTIPAVAPTCSTVGYTEGTKCSVCGTWLSGHETIPATGNHNYVHSGGYTFCDVCGYVEGYGYVSPSYTGKTVTLSAAKEDLAATTIGGYALLGGGTYRSASDNSNVVDAYDTSLIRSTPTPLSVARNNLVATTIGGYALFGGGFGDSSYSNVVDAYNTSLTRSTPTPLSVARTYLAATTIGGYALFGGGSGRGGYSNVVDAYDTSLTRSTPTPLSVARNDLAATAIYDSYAIFGGGLLKGTVDAYNTSLTRSIPTGVDGMTDAATSVGNYALLLNSRTVNVYNKSLTKTVLDDLGRASVAGTSLGNYAIVACAGGNTYSYNHSLTRTELDCEINSGQNNALSIGQYALFPRASRMDATVYVVQI